MVARELILARLRRALNAPRADATAIAAEADALLPDAREMQPKFDGQSNRERFMEKVTSERLTGTVDAAADMAAAVGCVRNYLMRSNLPLRIAMPPMDTLKTLDWGDIAVHGDIAADEAVSIGLADYAIAETGSVVFTSRPDSPTLYNYLPLHHIILVEADKILRYMEDFWAIVRADGNVHPRNINFITGTSGTADIEAKNVRGAHGPRFMHVVIIGAD
jgi:L-lactate dehydrogenase complex protein LldG